MSTENRFNHERPSGGPMTAENPSLKYRRMILLAEDDEDDYLLIRDALKACCPEDLEIHWVKDGVELVDYLTNIHRDHMTRYLMLILLDLNMPKKNGREALEEIKSHLGMLRIPIVVLTTSRAEDDVRDLYELGINSFLRKPSSYAEYIDLMRHIHDYWFHKVILPAY